MKYVFLLILITYAYALDFGSVTGDTIIPCPTVNKFYPTATCHNVTVSCSGINDISAIYGIILPSGTPIATVPLISGGNGNTGFDNGYVSTFLGFQYRVVQIVFPAGWQFTGSGFDQNLIQGACRAATMLNYVFEHVHGGNVESPYCAMGHSGGGTAIGYTLAWYNGDSFLDYALLGVGPIFSNITLGCIYPPAPQVEICPPDEFYCFQKSEAYFTDITFNNTFPPCSTFIETLVGFQCNCEGISDQPSVIAHWNNISILAPGAQTTYYHTTIASWVCKPPTNASAGQSQPFADVVDARNGYNMFLVSNCTGAEGIWGGYFEPFSDPPYFEVSGLQASSLIFRLGCFPKHL